MITALLIFIAGLVLSAFFSGSETGFYRVARVRLLIDALGGDRVAKGLLWASNNPAAFVATALMGNNVSNNLVAVATVMLTDVWFPGVPMAELGLTIAATPVVFIFGELLPKRLFFRAPYRLLRRCAPGLGAAAVLFSPFSLLLTVVSRVLEKVSRAPSQTVRMELARRELSEVLEEGHAVGLLTPTQRILAQNAFGLGGKPIRQFMTPAARQVKASQAMSRQEVMRLGARQSVALMPVEDATNRRTIVGYTSLRECRINPEAKTLPLRTLPEARESETYLSVLLRLQNAGAPMVMVRDASGAVVGFATTQSLREELLNQSA